MFKASVLLLLATAGVDAVSKSSGCGSATSKTIGSTYSDSFKAGGVDRTFTVFVPEDYDYNTPKVGAKCDRDRDRGRGRGRGPCPCSGPECAVVRLLRPARSPSCARTSTPDLFPPITTWWFLVPLTDTPALSSPSHPFSPHPVTPPLRYHAAPDLLDPRMGRHLARGFLRLRTHRCGEEHQRVHRGAPPGHAGLPQG